MEQLEGWLKRDNLKGFLLMVSEVIEYRFDDSDWDAFQAGLDSSNQGSSWFDYPLVGRVSVRVEISRFDEEGDVDIKVSLPADEPCLLGQIRAVWMVFNRLDVSPDVQLID
ncbi:hypothetical protein [Streptomyces sp. NRRL F-5122]|uniref:hypothetical protein n=1 Tax=Streptomyces sp. NRRL F-5122 TaxID=1609098 RepID=UPI00131CEF7D|nr:hypothetical protein [Streptomyces sp. NRRL F-5122]